MYTTIVLVNCLAVSFQAVGPLLASAPSHAQSLSISGCTTLRINCGSCCEVSTMDVEMADELKYELLIRYPGGTDQTLSYKPATLSILRQAIVNKCSSLTTANLPIQITDATLVLKTEAGNVFNHDMFDALRPGVCETLYVFTTDPNVNQQLRFPRSHENALNPNTNLLKAMANPLVGDQRLFYTELVDNANEATAGLEERRIDITLDLEKEEIVVEDNGKGQGKEGMMKMACLGEHEANNGPRSTRIGFFGIGFNTAVESISPKVKLESLVKDEDMVSEISYNTEENRRTKKWDCVSDRRIPTDRERALGHFMRITIQEVKQEKFDEFLRSNQLIDGARGCAMLLELAHIYYLHMFPQPWAKQVQPRFPDGTSEPTLPTSGEAPLSIHFHLKSRLNRVTGLVLDNDSQMRDSSFDLAEFKEMTRIHQLIHPKIAERQRPCKDDHERAERKQTLESVFNYISNDREDMVKNLPLFLHFAMKNPEFPHESNCEFAEFVIALFYHPCDRGVETLKMDPGLVFVWPWIGRVLPEVKLSELMKSKYERFPFMEPSQKASSVIKNAYNRVAGLCFFGEGFRPSDHKLKLTTGLTYTTLKDFFHHDAGRGRALNELVRSGIKADPEQEDKFRKAIAYWQKLDVIYAPNDGTRIEKEEEMYPICEVGHPNFPYQCKMTLPPRYEFNSLDAGGSVLSKGDFIKIEEKAGNKVQTTVCKIELLFRDRTQDDAPTLLVRDVTWRFEELKLVKLSDLHAVPTKLKTTEDAVEVSSASGRGRRKSEPQKRPLSELELFRSQCALKDKPASLEFVPSGLCNGEPWGPPSDVHSEDNKLLSTDKVSRIALMAMNAKGKEIRDQLLGVELKVYNGTSQNGPWEDRFPRTNFRGYASDSKDLLGCFLFTCNARQGFFGFTSYFKLEAHGRDHDGNHVQASTVLYVSPGLPTKLMAHWCNEKPVEPVHLGVKLPQIRLEAKDKSESNVDLQSFDVLIDCIVTGSGGDEKFLGNAKFVGQSMIVEPVITLDSSSDLTRVCMAGLTFSIKSNDFCIRSENSLEVKIDSGIPSVLKLIDKVELQSAFRTSKIDPRHGIPKPITLQLWTDHQVPKLCVFEPKLAPKIDVTLRDEVIYRGTFGEAGTCTIAANSLKPTQAKFGETCSLQVIVKDFRDNVLSDIRSLSLPQFTVMRRFLKLVDWKDADDLRWSRVEGTLSRVQGSTIRLKVVATDSKGSLGTDLTGTLSIQYQVDKSDVHFGDSTAKMSSGIAEFDITLQANAQYSDTDYILTCTMSCDKIVNSTAAYKESFEILSTLPNEAPDKLELACDGEVSRSAVNNTFTEVSDGGTLETLRFIVLSRANLPVSTTCYGWKLEVEVSARECQLEGQLRARVSPEGMVQFDHIRVSLPPERKTETVNATLSFQVHAQGCARKQQKILSGIERCLSITVTPSRVCTKVVLLLDNSATEPIPNLTHSEGSRNSQKRQYLLKAHAGSRIDNLRFEAYSVAGKLCPKEVDISMELVSESDGFALEGGVEGARLPSLKLPERLIPGNGSQSSSLSLVARIQESYSQLSQDLKIQVVPAMIEPLSALRWSLCLKRAEVHQIQVGSRWDSVIEAMVSDQYGNLASIADAALMTTLTPNSFCLLEGSVKLEEGAALEGGVKLEERASGIPRFVSVFARSKEAGPTDSDPISIKIVPGRPKSVTAKPARLDVQHHAPLPDIELVAYDEFQNPCSLEFRATLDATHLSHSLDYPLDPVTAIATNGRAVLMLNNRCVRLKEQRIFETITSDFSIRIESSQLPKSAKLFNVPIHIVPGSHPAALNVKEGMLQKKTVQMEPFFLDPIVVEVVSENQSTLTDAALEQLLPVLRVCDSSNECRIQVDSSSFQVSDGCIKVNSIQWMSPKICGTFEIIISCDQALKRGVFIKTEEETCVSAGYYPDILSASVKFILCSADAKTLALAPGQALPLSVQIDGPLIPSALKLVARDEFSNKTHLPKDCKISVAILSRSNNSTSDMPVFTGSIESRADFHLRPQRLSCAGTLSEHDPRMAIDPCWQLVRSRTNASNSSSEEMGLMGDDAQSFMAEHAPLCAMFTEDISLYQGKSGDYQMCISARGLEGLSHDFHFFAERLDERHKNLQQELNQLQSVCAKLEESKKETQTRLEIQTRRLDRAECEKSQASRELKRYQMLPNRDEEPEAVYRRMFPKRNAVTQVTCPPSCVWAILRGFPVEYEKEGVLGAVVTLGCVESHDVARALEAMLGAQLLNILTRTEAGSIWVKNKDVNNDDQCTIRLDERTLRSAKDYGAISYAVNLIYIDDHNRNRVKELRTRVWYKLLGDCIVFAHGAEMRRWGYDRPEYKNRAISLDGENLSADGGMSVGSISRPPSQFCGVSHHSGWLDPRCQQAADAFTETNEVRLKVAQCCSLINTCEDELARGQQTVAGIRSEMAEIDDQITSNANKINEVKQDLNELLNGHMKSNKKARYQ